MAQPETYAKAQVWLHWAVVLLLAGSFLSHEAMEDALRAAARGEIAGGAMANAHRAFGIVVAVLALARIALRFQHGAPPLPPGTHPLIALASKATHAALYALLLAIPFTGAAAWFGLSRDVGEVHEALFNLLAVLIALHVAAAVFHQAVLKDGLMRRMMP
jgi:cytochrome b561